MNPILVCVSIALLVGVTLWRLFIRAMLRAKKLESLAPAIGFSLVKPGTRFGFETPVFHRGKPGKNMLCNAMEGNAAGMRTVLFDFYYEIEVGSEEGSQTRRCTVAAFQAPDRCFPSFSITTKGMATWLEPNRLKIDEGPAFSERFVVTGADQSAVRTLLGPSLCQYLATAQLPEKIVIEGAGPWLVFYRRSKSLRPERWKGFIDETSAIASTFVQYCAAAQVASARFGD